ncbi:hypothetical protein BBJ29_005978 [Phytophthora kernoviae]|uniref:UBC core domain-containing protein n=1 Tax=Phytophthora kernoviae TaxID=325452 RepID=A0A3F2RIW4_9STRA|nr:hypothetical protein BBP00_00007163 [Phytophthora kernoviae]RLN60688.1 hypothetical protein BBJ29_005978 [Phytophthora kernoviae]
MGELHDKKTAFSLRSTDSKIAVCIAGWYVISLATLWTNRYIVAKLRVDSNLLSLAQLGMSVVGGLGSELYLVGWTVCKRGLRKVLNDGLKDMVLLAGVRILTVLLGLTALKYIAVSFTQTIKSSAPFFTVVLTYLLLGQRTGWRVNLSLFPIVTGLIFCSLSDSSFHVIGFIAALMSNCVDCIQNVLTKRLLNRSYSTSQLQLYTSIIAVAMQLMFILYNWMATPPDPVLEGNKTNRSSMFVFSLLIVDGMCFYIQSALAYMLMSLVSPITHSVANCVKRALIIVLSIYRYGEVVTPLNWLGMGLVIFGVYVFNEMSRNPPEGVSVGLGENENIFNWEIMLVGPPDTLYEGGFFKAVLDFPADFPNMPPKMTFKSEMWHPNVYSNGVVCISILHPPGEDQLNQQETADERWRPILGVESILVSVISMLSDPNDDSPANIDAAVEWRNDKESFKKHCRRIVRKSQEDF